MSDRSRDRSPRPPERESEILRIIADAQRHAAAVAELRAKHDARAAAAAALRQWFADNLHTMEPAPNQRPDSHIEPYIGLVSLAKRSTAPMHLYGRTSEITKCPAGTLVRVAINAREAPPAILRKAFARLRKTQLRQMRNPGMRAAGIVTEASVGDDGIVELEALVSNPVAAAKVLERVYSGCLVTLDGDEVSDVSLVDSPVGWLEKRGDAKVIAKVFTSEGERMSKDWKRAKKMAKRFGGTPAENYAALRSVAKAAVPRQPQISPSASAVIAEHARIEALAKGGADPLLVNQLQRRNDQALGIELVKAARRPAAVGDQSLVLLLRHGRS
jgi:hypothetical protein